MILNNENPNYIFYRKWKSEATVHYGWNIDLNVFLYSKDNDLVNIRLHLFTFIYRAIGILEHGGNWSECEFSNLTQHPYQLFLIINRVPTVSYFTLPCIYKLKVAFIIDSQMAKEQNLSIYECSRLCKAGFQEIVYIFLNYGFIFGINRSRKMTGDKINLFNLYMIIVLRAH